MNRKQFIKTTSIGLGLTLIPGILRGQTKHEKSSKLNNANPKIVKDKDGKILNVIGDIQTHKLMGSDTNNQIFEWANNVEPGVGIPPHIHTLEDEIFRVIKGKIEIMVDGKTTVLEAGDVAFAPKNVPHAWKVVGSEKAKMITSAFPAGIEHMFKSLSELPAGPPDFSKVAAICADHGITFL